MPRISDSGDARKPAIVFHEARKTFKLKHAHSFKEAFISAIQRKELSSNFNAVDGVSFSVPEGQSVALMGRNGSGKSTTLKMLSGVLQPDGGWVRTRGRIAGLLEVGAGFHPDLTGRQNVYLNAAILGMTKEETDAQFDSIVEFSEIGDFIDTEVKRYSSGMYSRLGFSVAVHTEVDVLLVDEILSVGDAAFRAKCNERMLQLRDQGKTMFVVSHNSSQVQQLCERGIVLDQGRVVFDGPIDEAVDFIKPPAARAELPFPVTGAIEENYARRAARFGLPTGPETGLSDGSGTFQEFERGVITSLAVPGPDGATFGLAGGAFLAAYLRAGGPTGPWGLISGAAAGGIDTFAPRTLEFQNGTARQSFDDGFSFIPRDAS